MTVEKFKELILFIEPSFSYYGKEYSICHLGGIFYVWSEDQPEDVKLSFADVNNLLDNWIIHGKRFRDILSEIDWE